MASVSKPIILGFILLGLGLLLHLIGFAAPYWHSREGVAYRPYRGRVHVHYGLWKYCQEGRHYGRPYDFCYSLVDSTFARDYIRASQFFETVGFLAALASLLLLLLGIAIAACRDRRILPILSSICAFGAAGCVILGCIIFGAKYEEKHHLSWAFALTIVGGIFYGFAGILVLIFSVIKR